MFKPIQQLITGSVLALTAAGAHAAAAYPSRPVHIIVPAAPGGALDLTTRLVAKKMEGKLGQPVIVENRPGAQSLVGTRYAKSQPADGYTLLAQANGVTLLPQIKVSPGYDPLKDFTGIGFMTRSPMILEVGSKEPDKTLGEFMARVKANPGKLSYGHGGISTPPQIVAASFLHAAGLDMTGIPYQGNGAALPDVIGNRTQMIVDGYISSISFIQAGTLRPLAVSSATRMAALPNVPTFKERGVDYTYTLWLGLLVRTGTPPEAIKKLSDALHDALSSKDLSVRFRAEGSDPSFVTPEAFNEAYAKEVSQAPKLAADLKLPKE